MRSAWGLFAFTAVVLRRLLRDRVSLFFILVLPVVTIVIIGATFGGQTDLRLGVADLDRSPASRAVVAALRQGEGLDVRAYPDRGDLEAGVRGNRVSAGLVVPEGFAAAAEAGRTATLPLVTAPSGGDAFAAALAVRSAVDPVGARIAAARLATAEAGGTFASNLALAAGLAPAETTRIVVEEVGDRGAALSRFSLVAPQNLVLFVFITSMTSAALIVRSRRLRVLRRATATRTGVPSILLGLGIGWMVVALVQSAIIIVVGAVAFGVSWGAPLPAALLVLTFALVGCGAGLLVGAVGRDEDRVSAITPVVGIVLGALGGCMVPLEVFPPSMLAVAHATPQYWAIVAWQDLVLEGRGLAAILPSLLVLAGFAVVLISTATALLRRDLTRG